MAPGVADALRPVGFEAGRLNSFDLLRIGAALCVFFGHQCDLAGRPEPTLGPLGISLSNSGLFIFFAVSGYLVAQSLVRAQGASEFLAARALRIYPGAAVNTLFCVALGGAVTALPSGRYWADGQTWAYLAHGVAILLPPTQFELPGVFADARWASVDTPIWTLKYELICYLGLLAVGAPARWLGLNPRRVLAAAAAALLVGYLWRISSAPAPDAAVFYAAVNGFNLLRFGMIFCAGALYASVDAAVDGDRRRLVLALIPAALVVWAPTPEVARAGCLLLAVPLSIEVGRSALLFSRRYRALGDLSYGLYLYSYPMQVLSVTRLPEAIGFWGQACVALGAAGVLATLSWTLVERPALRLKRRPRVRARPDLVTPPAP